MICRLCSSYGILVHRYRTRYTTTPFQCCGSGSTWNRIIMGSQIRVKGRIRIKVKFMSCGGSNGAMEGRGRSQWRPGGIKIVWGRVCRLAAADSHPFHEEQDQRDPDPQH
jgi:hypothetical protein